MTEAVDARRVRFGRRPTRGVLLGISRSRAIALAAAFMIVLPSLYIGGGRAVVITAPLWGSLAATAVVSVGGRSLAEWAPVSAHWLLRVVLRQNRFGVRPLRPRPRGTLALPGDAAAMRVHEDAVTAAAMLHDPHERRLTACLRVTHPAFIMLGPAEQTDRVDQWASVLAGLCQSGHITRLQIFERAIPDSGHAVSSWWERHGVRDGSWIAESYEDLVAEAGPAGERHDTLLAITLDLRRAARSVRREGGGLRGAAAVLRQEMHVFEEAVGAADLTPVGWLTSAELAVLARAAFDPSAAASLERGDAGRDIGTAGPMGVVEDWDHIRADGSFHTVLWITEWPRSEVHPGFLHPLVVGLSGVRRTISLIAEPLDMRRALRDIHRERVEHQTDDATRSRIGQIADLGKLQEWRDVEQREAELVAGHGDLRFAGLVAVSAPSLDELRAHSARVQLAATQCGCETRVLYGQQAQAFLAATFPIGRGL